MKGYVYILEVKDIDLPVSKIGMTERTPQQRCAEINQSSTGDFLWEVAYDFYVNDCRQFESLIHSRLAPLRQKRREFFNVAPEDAHRAVVSILEGQDAIQTLEVEEKLPEPEPQAKPPKRSKKRSVRSFRAADSRYVDLMHTFSEVLGVKGRPFGQLNQPHFGISDGHRGVQWNMVIQPEEDTLSVGVNLEGSDRTGRWLIADFLRARPSIEALATRVANPKDIIAAIYRDAWQAAARLVIREHVIGGRSFTLDQINEPLWESLIDEALSCLDETRDYRGRKPKQPVTLVSDGRTLERDISPHLHIRKELSLDIASEEAMKSTIESLRPVYDWVVAACQTYEV